MTLTQLHANMATIQDCGASGCVIRRRPGMNTNGPCHCYKDYIKMQRIARWMNMFLKANP